MTTKEFVEKYKKVYTSLINDPDTKETENKTREEVQEYYYSIVKPKLLDGTKSEYHRRAARKRSNTFRNTRSKAVSVQLDEVLRFFKKKSKGRE